MGTARNSSRNVVEVGSVCLLKDGSVNATESVEQTADWMVVEAASR
jgi:hypothetical protein